jgi:hypothetical protein
VGVDFGQFAHLREPTTPDNQPVICMNQDALYSSLVLDLSVPAEINLPEIGGRYVNRRPKFSMARGPSRLPNRSTDTVCS